ncbi:MAG: hypothetical protein WBD22_01815 [Pyrinomonadaceae bacterium]
MSKQTINVRGEDVVVREDTAKSFRGVYWALISVAGIILITAILMFGGYLRLASDTTPTTAPQSERR